MLQQPGFWNVIALGIGVASSIIAILAGVIAARNYVKQKRADAALIQVQQAAEADKREYDLKLAGLRGDNQQRKALFDLFGRQAGTLDRLTRAIESQTDLSRQRGERESEMFANVLTSYAGVTALIETLPELSKSQHVATREVLNAAKSEITGKLGEAQNAIIAAVKAYDEPTQRELKRMADVLGELVRRKGDTDKLNPAKVPTEDPKSE